MCFGGPLGSHLQAWCSAAGEGWVSGVCVYARLTVCSDTKRVFVFLKCLECGVREFELCQVTGKC